MNSWQKLLAIILLTSGLTIAPSLSFAQGNPYISNLAVSCSANGTQVNLSWLKYTSANLFYILRIDKEPFHPNNLGNNYGRYFNTAYLGSQESSASASFVVTPNMNYSWRVYAFNYTSVPNPIQVAEGPIFKCNVSYPPPQPRNSPFPQSLIVAPCTSSSCKSITTVIINGRNFEQNLKVAAWGITDGRIYDDQTKSGDFSFYSVIVGRTGNNQVIVDFHSLPCFQHYRVKLYYPGTDPRFFPGFGDFKPNANCLPHATG